MENTQARTFKFTILGEPFGKLNMQPMTIGGHARSFNPKANVEYMSRVIEVLDRAVNLIHFNRQEPVFITIVAFYKMPKSAYKYSKKTGETTLSKQGRDMLDRKIYPTKKPDLDNVSKVICDAITKQGMVWTDDSQVVGTLLMKYYDEQPRVEVILEKVLSDEELKQEYGIE